MNQSRYLVVGCEIDGRPYYSLSYRHFLANTKYVHSFGLFQPAHDHDQNDFVIVFPSANNPHAELTQPEEALSIRRLYEQGVKLGKILNIECVGDLNELIQQGRTKELILLSEAYHDMQIVNMAQKIAKRHFKSKTGKNKMKLVLISGPSSSGLYCV